MATNSDIEQFQHKMMVTLRTDNESAPNCDHHDDSDNRISDDEEDVIIDAALKESKLV